MHIVYMQNETEQLLVFVIEKLQKVNTQCGDWAWNDIQDILNDPKLQQFLKNQESLKETNKP
jgi:hypothetical protein